MSFQARGSRRPAVRSRSSDMGDVMGLAKDMAMFLERLQMEELSEDCAQVTLTGTERWGELNLCPPQRLGNSHS